MRKNHLFFLLFLWMGVAGIGSNGQAQDISDKARKYYEQSEPLILARKFDQAIAVLQKAVDKAPDYAEAHYRLGNVYELLQNDQQSQFHYEKSVQIKPDNRSFMPAFYTLGNLYLRKGEYAQAKANFEQFINLKPQKAAQIQEAQRGIATCTFAEEVKRNPLPFQPVALDKSVNRFGLQYFPVLTADQQTLIFTARDTVPGRDDENLYVSNFTDGAWTEPKPISTSINTPENEGTCSISADGRTIVFTSCKGRKNFGSCDLFVSYKTGDEWTTPINLGGKVNSIAWESQPALSADGRTLFYVSDRRGGSGKRDIWVSELAADGYWGAPINLGSLVNTPDDDLSPFIHVNGKTLFFSSKGHLGLGGFDLFYTEKTENGWNPVKNLGYPINTHDDQVSLFVTADGKKGYYSLEARRGRQYISSVIHEFAIPEQIAIKDRSDYLKGTVYDAKTKQKIGAGIELYNLATGKREALTRSDQKNGSYLTVLTEGASYALYVNKEGYLFKSMYFDYAQKKEYEPLVIDVYLQPLEKGAKDILNNLFFATGSYELEEKSKTELDKLIKLLNDNKTLKLEISGHTDDVGKDADNVELSLKRAQTVHDYLVKSGVPAGRLAYKGYGETQFYKPNTSEDNRRLNRRIEFKVL